MKHQTRSTTMSEVMLMPYGAPEDTDRATIEITFAGIDYWGRAVFVDIHRNYYGCTDQLFDYSASKEDVCRVLTAKDITYFGREFGCEPWGGKVKQRIVFVDSL